MAELSYLWDGIAVGDATEAPYDKIEFNKYISGIHVGNSDELYVIPGYLDDLEPKEAGSASVAISAGAAILQNYIYINTSQVSVVVSSPQSAHFRYDYVILRLDKNNQLLRIDIIEGTEVTDPVDLVVPELLQTNNIWEQPLALLFSQAGTAMSIEYIYDQRNFSVTNYTRTNFDAQNLFRNSEFMAIDSTGLPEFWAFGSGTVTVQAAASKTDLMPRGQTFSLNSTKFYFTNSHFEAIGEGDVFTVKGTLKEITGTDSFLLFMVAYITSTNTMVEFPVQQRFVQRTVDENIEFKTTFKIPSDVYNPGGLRIYLTSREGTTNIGQIMVVRGYHPGPFRQVEEFIPFETVVTDVNWSDTAKSTAITAIDFTADFGAAILPQTKAVVLRIRGRDSASAAGSPYISLLGYVAPFTSEYGRLDLEGVPNNIYREITCIVPVNQPLWDAQSEIPQLRIDVGATGAGTLDATVEVIGIFI